MGREVTPLGASGTGTRWMAGVVALAAALGLGPSARAFEGPDPGAATATSLTLPDGPASIRGLADAATVDVFTGQVNYAIPLDLPKGPGGFGPSFALQYSGETGNGPIGIGWSLGTIMIKRSERFGVPTFTDSDELDLIGIGGGGRLVRDPDHTSPQQYWVEGKGHSISVVQSNARFVVTDSNGVRYYLGNSDESREEQGARVSAWMVDWIVDVAGNEVDFSYTKASNRVYLTNIAWGPQQTGPAFQVFVDYAARTDIEVSYRAGFPISTASRVTDIRVQSFGHTLRTYNLIYDQTFALSRLVEIDQSGLDVQVGQTPLNSQNSLPPVKLTYGGILQPEMVSFAATDGWTLNQRGVVVADVNGDGVADLLRLEAGDPEYLEGRGNYFGTAQPVPGASDFGLDQAALVDFDGDSRPELVHVVDDTWRAFSLSGTTWQSIGEWQGTNNVPLKGPNVVLADLNGDGKIDVIQPRGSGGINVNFGAVGGLGPTLELPPLSATDVAVVPGDPNTRFVDVNGDGLADIVWVTDAWMKVFLGQGDGTFIPYVRAPYPWGASAGVDLSNIMFGDLDRDGLVDLVKVDAANVTWFRGETDGRFGTAFFRHLARPESVDADAVVTIADMNGNGSQDVVWSSPRGLWALDLAGATSAGMITQIDNGLGMTTTFTYDASGSMAVAAERSGDPWQVLLPTSVPIPVTVETDPGAGGAHRITQHLVRDGFWDGIERRLGGFLVGRATTVAANPADSTVVESRFLEGTGSDRELRGKPYFVQQLRRRRHDRVACQVDLDRRPGDGASGISPSFQGSRRSFAALSTKASLRRLRIRTLFQFDGEVRPTLENHLGRVDVTGDEMIVKHTYQSDTQVNNLGIRDRDCEDVTLEGDGMTVVSDLQRLYGDSTATILPFGQVGKGWVRVQQELLASEMRYVPQRTTSYDTFGNPISTTEKGVTHDMSYDPMGLFPVGESIEGANPPLSWSATWDDVRGRIPTVTDPNGNVTNVGYDSLARPISVALNGLSPHIHYTYQWTPPLPSTTSWVFDGDTTALAAEGPSWPVGSHWRPTTSVANGATEALFSTTPVSGQFIVSGWKQRDERGQTVQSAESFYLPAAPTVSPPVPPTGTRIQTIAYDSQGRVVLQTLPNGATKATSYRALGQTITSSELGPVSSDTDGLMRIVHTERDPGRA